MALDACGVCNGPGPIFQCGCTNIPDGGCNCDGDQLDAIGVCGGDCQEDLNGNGICDDDEPSLCGAGTYWNPDISQCSPVSFTDTCSQYNFDFDGNFLVGASDLIVFLTWFETNYDQDGDGISDCEDDCVGAYDECGVCNGPGPQVQVIDTIIIAFDSIYVDAIDDWLVYELSTDTIFSLVCEEPIAFNTCGQVQMDGYNYSTVQIGNQCWFSENLRTTIYADGTGIPQVSDNGAWTDLDSGARCDYNNDAANVATYGRMYNWFAATDVSGLCPTGWHVPTTEEWTQLEDYITSQGFSGTEGTALKSTTGWPNDGGGTDDFGYSALPGGYRSYSTGASHHLGFSGNWWSSSSNGGSAWYRSLYPEAPIYSGTGVPNIPKYGLSVRCLRDDE